MDPRLLHALHEAIEELGRHRFGTQLTVAEAKHRARDSLIAFGQQPLSVSVREAMLVLGQSLEEIESDDPSPGWEPLFHALQVLEHAVAGEARS